MLVLTRYQNETILIGENITVTVVEIRGCKVRLGIMAPPDVQIMRPDAINKAPKEREQTSGLSNETSA